MSIRNIEGNFLQESCFPSLEATSLRIVFKRKGIHLPESAYKEKACNYDCSHVQNPHEQVFYPFYGVGSRKRNSSLWKSGNRNYKKLLSKRQKKKVSSVDST